MRVACDCGWGGGVGPQLLADDGDGGGCGVAVNKRWGCRRAVGRRTTLPMLTPVLSSFGFHAQAFWWPDTALLAIVFGVFLLASYLVLEIYVKERR